MGKISVETDSVLRVSLPGNNVETATPEQCAIHSGFDYPKIEEHLEGYEEITLPNTISDGFTVLKTVTHNYGYKPNVLIYVYIIGADEFLYNTSFEILPYIFTEPVFMWYDYDVSTTDVKIGLQYNDIWGGGDLTPGEGSPAGKKIGLKWQVWVND